MASPTVHAMRLLMTGVGACALAAASCSMQSSLSDADIASCVWKAGGPPAIGDGLSFGVSGFAIKDGMIHRDSIVVAQITDRKPRWFADDIIIVRNLDTGTTGAYHEKGCR